MKAAIISASPRPNSNSMRVALAVKRILVDRGLDEASVDVVDFAGYDIPLSGQGRIEPGQLSPFQQELFDALQGGRLVVMVVPEYNWTMPAELANFIHRMGDRPFLSMFDRKTFALIGVSSGQGGRQPAVQLTYILGKIIGFFELDSVISSKIFESHFSKETLNEQGASLGKEAYDKGLEKFVDYSLQVSRKWLGAI